MRLSTDRGLNPRLTYCPRCGGDGDTIVLLGDQDKVYRCDACNTHLVGNQTQCPHHPNEGKTFLFRLGENERLPVELCDACKEELEQWKEIIAQGGVYWKCPKGHDGVITTSPFANTVREALQLPPPAPCGVELTEKSCPVCNPGKESNEEN